ncbi:MAG: HNH endonuclease signature motif containing protein [Nostoc sp.]|uniref:HNH endonuclease signature motif containing protein n=1 Tax=Nostoc sp. TaxID=1180 RepID=UPI002FFC2912
MEHIIAEKHRGTTEAENLALACPYCNRAKGTDLGSIHPETGKLTPFFNPRTQKWSDRFQMNRAEIAPLTSVGRVTVAILQFNQSERLEERDRLIWAGQYS